MLTAQKPRDTDTHTTEDLLYSPLLRGTEVSSAPADRLCLLLCAVSDKCQVRSAECVTQTRRHTSEICLRDSGSWWWGVGVGGGVGWAFSMAARRDEGGVSADASDQNGAESEGKDNVCQQIPRVSSV